MSKPHIVWSDTLCVEETCGGLGASSSSNGYIGRKTEKTQSSGTTIWQKGGHDGAACWHIRVLSVCFRAQDVVEKEEDPSSVFFLYRLYAKNTCGPVVHEGGWGGGGASG